MRLLTLTIIAAAAFVDSASAQTATQLPATVPYGNGERLLRRRPFAPGGEFTPPPAALPGWETPYFHQRAQQVFYPLYSPYSMIQYDWLQKGRPVEALPAPVPPVVRPPMPPVKPAVPPTVPPKTTTPPAKPDVPPAKPDASPAKPGGPIDLAPTRPTFLPPEGRE